MIKQIYRNSRKRRSRVIGSTCHLAKLCAQSAMAATMVLALENVAVADPLAFVAPSHHQSTIFDRIFRDQGRGPDATKDTGVPANVARGHRGQAVRYGIGVGREGFTWSGVQVITRKAEWPDWSPPAEMLSRQPYLPRVMAGGPGNPLGARAMYLGDTAYRIHGTNQPDTIGKHVSSGCIRMLNDDVIDLYARVNVGTKVIVLPDEPHRALDASAAHRQRQASLY